MQNPRVKLWAQLLDKKTRDKEQKYIVEGIHLVQEALKSQEDVECVVHSLEQGLPREIEWPHDAGIERIGVTEAIIAKCTDAVTPQPVFAVIRKRRHEIEALLRDRRSLVVVVDGVQDPGNLGTIIRSADAVGATGVVIGRDSVDVYNPKTIRSTMGSLFHLPVVVGDLPSLLEQAKQQGVRIVSTSLQAQSHCYGYDFTQPTWIILGNEAKGVSAQAAAFVDPEDQLIIPMRGQAESLNVAMAATVLLYEAQRQRYYRI